MAGVLGFLFDGKPPPSTTTYGTNTTNVPQWYSDYAQGILNSANSVAGQPYQPYQGPRIAGLTPEQQQALQLSEGNIGSYKPALQGATGAVQGTLGMLQPTIAGNLEGASRTFPGAASGYVNPYIQNVTKRAQDLANRNFQENLLPSIKNIFTRAGQYGSQTMQDAAYKGARDVSEGLQSTADASLANAWNTAGQQFASDASRQGTLAQLGVTGTGQLSGQLGQLGQLGSQLGVGDAAQMEAVGQTLQNQQQRNLDLAYQDFLAQREYPRSQVDWLSGILHGTPPNAVPTSTTTTSTAPYNGEMQPGLVGQLGSLLSLWKAIGTDNPNPQTVKAVS